MCDYYANFICKSIDYEKVCQQLKRLLYVYSRIIWIGFCYKISNSSTLLLCVLRYWKQDMNNEHPNKQENKQIECDKISFTKYSKWM